MPAVENAIIAAAGLGSRLGLGLPKCMIEIEGTTLISRMIRQLERHVENIRVAVGYREEMIIEHLRKNHPSTVIARNRDYRTTNTAHSHALAARHLQGKTLFLDGDLLIRPDSLSNFIASAANANVLIGVARATSEHAVFVHGAFIPSISVGAFSRDRPSEYEWANVVSGPVNLMNEHAGYVYERLEESLPLRGFVLEIAEIDTESDLEKAHAFARTGDW